MKVLHVEGKELKEIDKPYIFYNGDVYLIDDSDRELNKKVFIWLGSKSSTDEKAVGAWAAKVLDIKDADIDIDTEVEGSESDEFKKVVSYFEIRDGGIPGFLKHVDVNAEDISYAMYRIYDADIADGSSTDDIEIKSVPMKRSSLVSGDVFVLDAYHSLFVWVGKDSQVGEKAAGNRLARMFDVDRERTPMIYAINEGSELPEFFELMEKLAGSEDIRKDDADELEEEMSDVVEAAEMTEPPPDKPERIENIVQIYYNHETREFCQQMPQNADAVLRFDIANNAASLSFTESAGLIVRRTAERQARGICKTGFELSNGARVGIKFDMVVESEATIEDRLLQQGHHYK